MAIQPTLPVREWSPDQRKAVERKAIELLDGVGDTGAEHWQLGSRALHYRRPMTMAEALRLPSPPKLSPGFLRRARARAEALDALGIIRASDIQQTERTI